MKSLKSIKNYGLALLAMMLMLTAANAQSRYKHVPRVKVDKKYTEKVTIKEKQNVTTTTTAYMNVEVNKEVATETPVVTTSENTTVASTTEDVVVVDHKTNNVVKHNKVVKTNKKVDRDAFTEKVKDNSKLMDVKDVKKTNMERWLLIMIILLAAGFLCLILAIVFSFTFIYVLGLIFWILAGLLFTAALVILVLGLTGVL